MSPVDLPPATVYPWKGMNTYQLILSHITAVLFCFSLYHLGKVFIVHKKLNNYAYFCIATFGGCLYVFLGLLLSFPLEDAQALFDLSALHVEGRDPAHHVAGAAGQHQQAALGAGLAISLAGVRGQRNDRNPRNGGAAVALELSDGAGRRQPVHPRHPLVGQILATFLHVRGAHGDAAHRGRQGQRTVSTGCQLPALP